MLEIKGYLALTISFSLYHFQEWLSSESFDSNVIELVAFFFRAPPMCLLPNSHYEQVMTAFGGKGYFVQTPEELQKSLKQALADTTKPSLINIMIEPQSARKAQVHTLAEQEARGAPDPTRFGKLAGSHSACPAIAECGVWFI